MALAGNGRTVAVSSVFNKPDGEIQTGHVRVFQYNETSGQWTQIGRDIDGAQEDSFWGCSLSLSYDGTILAVGAQFHDTNAGLTNAGLVQMFAYNGVDWIPFGSTIQGSSAGELFGVSVGLSETGTLLAAGSRMGNSGIGQVRSFFFSIATGTWRALGSPINGKEEDELFGSALSVSADGNSLAVGAPQANDLAGATRIYSLIGLEWFQIGDDILGDAPGDESGKAVALAPKSAVVAIGAPASNAGGTNSGQVRVFQNIFS